MFNAEIFASSANAPDDMKVPNSVSGGNGLKLMSFMGPGLTGLSGQRVKLLMSRYFY